VIADRRRVTALAAGAMLLPVYALAQPQPRLRRIGLLVGARPPADAADPVYDAFRRELEERGHVVGKNISLEWRYSEGHDERFPELAAELAGLDCDLIVVSTGGAALAAKQAAPNTPIVLAGTSDPVGRGLVASLARPGGNITGIVDYQADLFPKRLELIRVAVPKLARLVSLSNAGGLPAARVAAIRKEQDLVAQTLDITLTRVELASPEQFDMVTGAVMREHPDALVVIASPASILMRKEIADFAIKQRLPTVGSRREEALAGLLVTYGVSIPELFRVAAAYVDKILAGAKPADLPVEQPTRFELVINLKTARALGLTIPQSLLLRADEVIQ